MAKGAHHWRLGDGDSQEGGSRIRNHTDQPHHLIITITITISSSSSTRGGPGHRNRTDQPIKLGHVGGGDARSPVHVNPGGDRHRCGIKHAGQIGVTRRIGDTVAGLLPWGVGCGKMLANTTIRIVSIVVSHPVNPTNVCNTQSSRP
jgi:hypothetical protein